MEFNRIFKNLAQVQEILREIQNLFEKIETIPPQDRAVFERQLQQLEKKLFEKNNDSINTLSKINLVQKLEKEPEKVEKKKVDYSLQELDEITLKRLKKKEKIIVKEKEFKPDFFVSISNKYFSSFSNSLVEKGTFDRLKRELSKGNFPYLVKTYVSMMLFSTSLAFLLGIFAMVFFLFFNISSYVPFIIASKEVISTRILKVFWIPIFFPIITFFISYVYPSLERSSIESKINHELPFATIHMSAISGSSIEPSKIFQIIISTKEYPAIEKELYKIINEMNIFGKDLVTALRTAAQKCPSKKLSDLFNGIATTVTSGGDLSDFFDKRANTLLFDYRLEREKETKSAETFMDIYISVVIAAPMILMLLLIMMKVSGIGISLSTGMITLIMISAVVVINIGFLTLLQMKQAK